MGFVKRFWAPLLAASLGPLLLILAAYQIAWIRDLGNRERSRLYEGLLASADLFADAFATEIDALPAIFGRPTVAEDRELFERRWEFWRAHATAPEIVEEFLLISAPLADGSVAVSRWNGNSFSAYTDAKGIRALLDGIGTIAPFGPPAIRDPIPLSGGTEAVVLSGTPGDGQWLVILIDERVLEERLIPLLAERYLPGNSEYLFRIVNETDGSVVYRSGASATPEAFVSPDLRFSLTASGFRPRPSFQKGGRPDLPPDSVRGPEEGGSRPPRSRVEGIRWRLEAVHHSGSLASAVKANVARSAAVSFGILIVMAAVIFILASAVRRSQQLAARQQEFIATVTHELKTPVAVIRSAAENLADGVVTDRERTARYGGVIRRESGRLADMIDGLLAYARVGDAAPRGESVFDLSVVVLRALNAYGEDLQRAGFKVERSVRSGVFVRGDEQAMELAVRNLVANAIKHAADGAFLGVAVDSAEKKRRAKAGAAKSFEARLTVRDAGPGIPRNERKLVFDLFFRGRKARAKQSPGSGIGLNLVSRIVTAHGGTIELECAADRGSAFIIRLPQEEPHHG